MSIRLESLLEGNADQNFAIESYARGHTHIAPKLKELKDIIVRYYPEKDIDLLNSALFDIITCEQDLHSHCQVEDMIFIPAVAELEAKVRPGGRTGVRWRKRRRRQLFRRREAQVALRTRERNNMPYRQRSYQ